ncbi:hypothetical protein [Microbacterium sp. NPDC076911]|uniref:hypothetical protein n=1 Tax=Microbacterium sp. NPDC076911 TaxID=3154958 RepID=UPI003441D825
MAVGLADALGLLRRRGALPTAIVLTAGTSLLVEVPEAWDFLSLSGFFRLMPFFLLGYLFAETRNQAIRYRWLALTATLSLFALRSADVFGWIALDPVTDGLLRVSLGVAAIATVLSFRHYFAWKPLAWLGYFSHSPSTSFMYPEPRLLA